MNYDNLCSNCLLKQKRKFEDIIIMAYVILSKFIFCTYFEFENWKCYFAAWFFFFKSIWIWLQFLEQSTDLSTNHIQYMFLQWQEGSNLPTKAISSTLFYAGRFQ